MKTLFLILAVASLGWTAEQESGPSQTACKPGGFTLMHFGSVEVRGKADANFSVLFDASNYQGNGFDSALRSAMSTWSSVSGSTWRYTFGGYSSAPASSYDGVMTTSQGGYSFPGGVLAVTVVSAVASTGQIVDADIFFNPSYAFTTSAGGGIDFESVALHEMGHGLGLDHNDGCTSTPTVMYSRIAAGTQSRSLFSPETDGVRYLYPGAGGGGSGDAGVTASPSSLAFTAAAGGAPPAPQTIALSGVSGTLWSATASTTVGAWLSVSPRSGTAPALLTVTATTSGLIAGFYSGRVTVISGGTSRDVTVSLNLTAPPVLALELSPASLRFSAVAGGPAPSAQNAGLTGSSGLSWSATVSIAPAGSWLRVSPSGGTVPAVLAVSVSSSGLEPGLYAGKVTVSAGGLTRDLAVQLEVTIQPGLLVDPSQITFSSLAASTAPACASVSIRDAANSTFDWTATSGAFWLTVLPVSGRGAASISLCATAGGLAPGDYPSSASISASIPNSPRTIQVRFVVTPSVTVSDGGVTNAASFLVAQPVAAGELLSVFGVNLASRTAWATGFPLPTELGDCRVLLGGVPAPLIYVSPGQVNLVAPSVLADVAGSTTTLTVYNGRLASPPARVAVARQSPGVFTLLGIGAGAGAVTHADGSVVSRSAPLQSGEIVSVYLTGMGPVEPAAPDGAPAPSHPLARALSPVRLLLDGREAAVFFAGAAPGFAGLQVVVAAVPGSLQRRFPEMVVEVQGVSSNRFTAGGPSLLDVSPATVPPGKDATVSLRGLNLSSSSAVLAAGATLPANFTDGDWQSLRLTIPARLLGSPGTLALTVIDTQAPAEPPSNPVVISVQQ